MQISFDLTMEDRVAFNMYHFAHSRTTRRARLRSFIWVSAIWMSFWLLLVFSKGSPTANARALWPLLIFIPLYGIMYPFLMRRHMRKTVQRLMEEGQNRGVLGRKQVTITPVEITAGDDLKLTTVRWKAVERIEVTDAYAYFYFSALEAVIIPRRAFTSDADFTTWVETARKYQAATSG